MRVFRPWRRRFAVDLFDGVFDSVHHHVEPDVEKVLVVRTIDAWRDQRAVGGLNARCNGPGRDDASELDLILDGPVLVEVPEEAVLVVADGGDGRDHEAARPPHLW